MFKKDDIVYIVVENDSKYFIYNGYVIDGHINSYNQILTFINNLGNHFYVSASSLSFTEYGAIEKFKLSKINEINKICKSLETRKSKLEKLNESR